MASSWPKGLRPKDYLLLIVMTTVAFTLPFLAIISTIIYTFALFISCFLPNYGKFINYFDAWMEEDFVSSIPRSSVVTTLTLQGDLTLEELRSLFKENVLEARSKLNPKKIRYPELGQYLTTLLGFRIWKNDANFLIENHIVESSHSWNGDLESIHQELLNKTYNKHHSPWEVILIRNVNLMDNDNNNGPSEPRSIVACRVHHVIADAKSLLKLFVECLGGAQLKTASSNSIQETWFDKIRFYLMFPLNYLTQLCRLFFLLPQSHLHPWKVQAFWQDTHVKTVLAFSPKLQMSDIKQIAKRNSVTTSAAVMNIVAGGIRKCCTGENREVAIGYPLPKPDHPEILTNHILMGIMKLPTDEASTLKRLQECNKQFLYTKAVQQERYLNFFMISCGIQFFPLTRLVALNNFTPTGITNIAGQQEKFSVGKLECEDFRMSVGTLAGVAGVVFCAFSYNDGIRIAVIAKESILQKDEAEKLAADIGNEFQLLMSSQ